MVPVNQSIVDSHEGDCFRACVASILELDLEDVTNFAAASFPVPATKSWFKDRGLALLQISTFHLMGVHPGQANNLVSLPTMPGLYAIANVPSQSQREGLHAIVVTWEESEEHPGLIAIVVAHDPNPDNEPYDLCSCDIFRLSFIVPLRPTLPLAGDISIKGMDFIDLEAVPDPDDKRSGANLIDSEGPAA